MTNRFAVQMAIGRILWLASRPEHPGDIAEYERCRAFILDLSEAPDDRAPNYQRDRLRGAQGDA